jgi:hypothetical protein
MTYKSQLLLGSGIILATQAAEIRTKPAQPNSSKDPISKIKKPSRTQKKGLVDWF